MGVVRTNGGKEKILFKGGGGKNTRNEAKLNKRNDKREEWRGRD